MSPKPEPGLPEVLGLGHIKTPAVLAATQSYGATIQAEVPESKLKRIVLMRLKSLAYLIDRAITDPPGPQKVSGPKPRGIAGSKLHA